jgi:SET domain-containing protein
MSDAPFRIGKSKTGFGLFATGVIPKDKRIFEYTGKLITNAQADSMKGTPRYLANLNNKFTVDGSPRSNIGRYANHSCKPNARMYTYRGKIYVGSIRTIQPGEEITYDYGKEYFDAYITKASCLCVKCEARRERERSSRPVRRAAASEAKRPPVQRR